MSSALIAASGALIVGGCMEFPEPEYATPRVDIATSFDGRVCAGTAAKIERWALDASDRLGIDPLSADAVLLVWGNDAVREYCDGDVKGCYLYEPGVIAASYSAVSHELVHATTRQQPGADRNAFVEEGIAEAMTTSTVRRGIDPILPSVLVTLPTEEFEVEGNRALAGHFFRYLSEEHGFDVLDGIRTELQGPVSLKTADEVFVDLLGVSFEDAEQAWLADSPGIYTRLSDDAPLADAILSDSVTLQYSLACDNHATHAPLTFSETEAGDPVPGMSSALVLDVVTAGEFEVLATPTPSADGGLVFRSLACWDGAVRNVVHEVAFGVPSMFALDACRWEALVWTSAYVATETQVTISRL